MQSKKKIKWSEWILYTPTDIPYQISKTAVLSGNCGVHVCCWALTIATCSNISFTEENMDGVRKVLANILYYAKTNPDREKLTNKSRKPLFIDAHEIEKNNAITAYTSEKIVIKAEPPMNFKK